MTERQTLINLLTDNDGNGGLVWLYWPQDDKSWSGNWVLSHACLQRPNSTTRWERVDEKNESDCLAPPGPWIKLVLDLDRETNKDQIIGDHTTQPPTDNPMYTAQAPLSTPHKEQLSWHHFISHNGRIYKPVMTGRELKNVTCKFFTFPKHGDRIWTQFQSLISRGYMTPKHWFHRRRLS